MALHPDDSGGGAAGPALGTNPTLLALGYVTAYAVAVGFTDNFVRAIADEGGLWQFHALRTAMALPLLALAAPLLGLTLRPRSWRAVAARSALHASAMMIYFGCLAFLPVANVAAALFTAPIFTLLISRFAFGIPIGPWRIVAVAIGFLGAALVLGLKPGGPVHPASLLPVLAGALYATGNIATRAWCAQESTGALLAGFFAALGLAGLAGMAVLALWAPEASQGAAGFVLRGVIWPSPGFLFWTFVQAAGSLLAVGCLIRAYLLADASRVAVFEYIMLPASAAWGWLLWGDRLAGTAALGIVLIFVAGLIITLRAR